MKFDREATHPLRPICTGWIGKIDRAIKHKKPFQDTGNECMDFFCASSDFMWSDKNRERYKEVAEMAPRFRMTICKAFELVALFGPVLYHDNPFRGATPREPFFMPPELMGGLQTDPNLMMAFQMAMQQQQQQGIADKTRAELMQRLLNVSPNELPNGGLRWHAQTAITEALIRGRGLLWSEPHFMPDSDRMLVGSFFDSVDNLVIDADAETIDTAWWCAKKCIEPVWKVERDRQMPKDYLKGVGTIESATAQGESWSDDLDKVHRSAGRTNDLMVYWKVWSKMGIGARLEGVKTELGDELERVFGDYVYLEVSEGIPFPLNLWPDQMRSGDQELWIRNLQWPVPFWMDDRWPFSQLDFYQKPRNVWPLAPIAPGLGELKFLNIMVSHLCNRIWSSSRDFIVVLKAATEELKSTLEKGSDLAIVELDSSLGDSIDKVVRVLSMPQVNFDVWKIIEAVTILFEKRTGLSELVYAMSSRQMRSAQEASLKGEQINVRPDQMAKEVQNWMTEAARKEAMCMRWNYQAEDVAYYLGPMAGTAWNQLILMSQPENITREVEYRIEATSMKKPNIDRDLENANQALNSLSGILQGYAQTTGDTQPINTILAALQKSTGGLGVDPIVLGPWVPPAPPPMMGPDGMPMDPNAMPPEQVPPPGVAA